VMETELPTAGSGRARNTTIDAVAATEIFLAKRPHKKRWAPRASDRIPCESFLIRHKCIKLPAKLLTYDALFVME